MQNQKNRSFKQAIVQFLQQPYGAVSGYVISGVCIFLGIKTPDVWFGQLLAWLGQLLIESTIIRNIFFALAFFFILISIFQKQFRQLILSIKMFFSQPIVWKFTGFYIGLMNTDGQDFVISIQGSGRNNGKEGITDLKGYIQSNITNEKRNLYYNIEGDLYLPTDTNGIGLTHARL